MYITAASLDDLLFKVYRQILERGRPTAPTKGSAREISGVLLKLSSPRARLSRTESRGRVFSCLGEFLWILSGSNKLDFIQYYIPRYAESSDDAETIYGAYGPRLFGPPPNDQIPRVVSLLKRKQHSRQAVAQIFDRSDTIEFHKDVPCTCTLQFLIRENRLHMLTHMRSNDAWLGLPHDVFVFTMIQELIARSLGVELGSYKHSVGSLHLYSEHEQEAVEYLQEGWQLRRPMPPMPHGDPWDSVHRLLKFEQNARTHSTDASLIKTLGAPYWDDLGALLLIYGALKMHRVSEIRQIMRTLNSDVYSMYIKKRLKSFSEQLSIFEESDQPKKDAA